MTQNPMEYNPDCAHIKAGWGYHRECCGNLTGCFERAEQDIPVEVEKRNYGGYPDKVLVMFEDGSRGLADAGSLEPA